MVNGGALIRGYRPWLDGVRAVAILLVLVQHVTSITRFGLGGAGVGLFFALSGYLITGLLLDEQARSGRLDLRRFYLRRAARLLPALALMVTVTSALLFLVGLPEQALGAVPALLYMGNYVAVLVGGWHPVFGPTWSLAVEEHFYLVWPMILLIAMGPGRSPRRALRVTLAICAFSVLWRILMVVQGAPSMLLYAGSLSRADALLFGCAAAAAVRLGWWPGRTLFLVGTGLVLGYMCLPMLNGPVQGSAVLGIGGALVVCTLDCCPSARIRGAFSARPAVQVGVWSYGVYLWHVPLLFLAVQVGVTGLVDRLAVVALTVAVAAASHRWFETPIRNRVRAIGCHPAGQMLRQSVQ